MKIRIFGQPVTAMQIGTRQLRLRGAGKVGKPTMILKSVGKQTLTEYVITQQLKFGRAAISARGGTMEDVVRTVERGAKGAVKPESVWRDERRAQHERADRHMAALERLQGRGKAYVEYGAGLPSHAVGPPAEYL